MNKGIVATGSYEATQAASDILRAGGNAFDAAVSAVFTSMTSEFALTGAGGGGAMMVRTSGSEPLIYDFFVDTPERTGNEELDFFDVEVDFGDSKQIFNIGKGSAAVPGTLLGLITIHEQFGVVPLSVVMEPAIHLARTGSVLNKQQAYIFKLLKPIFSHTPEGQSLFYSNGKILTEGDRFINSEFGDFLERVSQEGATFFYLGEGAKLITENFGIGGLLNEDALKNYHVAVRKPVMTSFMDSLVYSNPAPSVGGTLIIFLLRLLEEGKKQDLTIFQLLKAMEVTNAARLSICINPNNEYQINKLLEDKVFIDYFKIYCSTHPSYKDDASNPSGGATTHVSVIDKDQNAACVTTTNGEGCGYILPGTGIMMNNMLGEEDLNPQGFHKWSHPMRLPTMISPSIIMKEKQPFILLGSGGSNRIRSAIVQVILNCLDKDMDLESAILSPRIHLEGNQLYFEPGIDIDKTVIPEHILLNPFDDKNLFFGGVNAVTLKEGYSDPRRGGTYEIV